MASNVATRVSLLYIVEILLASTTTGLTEHQACSLAVDAAEQDLAELCLLQTQVTKTASIERKASSESHAPSGSHESAQSNATADPSTAAAFKSFLEKHGREYSPGSADYDLRQNLFLRRAEETARHNAKPNRLWTAAVNKLADRSHEELSALLGWSGSALPGTAAGSEATPPSFLQVSDVSSVHPWGHAAARLLPMDFSWGRLNSTQHVHNQGDCGSCWAVSSASVLQAHVEIHRPHLARSLSVQELVSCVANARHCGGSGGCDGATAELAMEYAMRHGLSSSLESAEAEQPSTMPTRCPKPSPPALVEGSASSQSHLDISTPGVHAGTSATLLERRSLGMRAWERLPPNSYAPLMQSLVQRGPAAVAVFASLWFSYSHGIFDGCEKDAVIDHAVALLGYGNDLKLRKKYWTIQNSWGPEWGENGRIRLLRRSDDDSEHCGIDKQPMAGTGCDGGPAEVKVCGMCGILYDTVVPHF